MEANYNSKRYAAQIKIIDASKVAPVNSDSNTSANMPWKKTASSGVLPTRKQQGKKISKHKASRI